MALRAVSEVFNVSPKRLLSYDKGREATQARFVLYLIVDEAVRKSKAVTGRIVRRDRTTVIYGLNAAVQKSNQNPAYREKLERARSLFQELGYKK